MDVVLATSALVPGGVWRHVLDLAAGLESCGCRTVLALRSSARVLQDDANRNGLTWRPLRSALLEPSDVWHLHLHDTYDGRALPALLAARARRAGLVVTEHLPRTNASDPTLLPGDRTLGAATVKGVLKRTHARLVDRIIVVSAGSASFIRARYGIPGQLIRVIENGVEAGSDPGPPAPDAVLRVVALGSLAMQKGHDVLLAAAAIARRRWDVTIYGEGSGQPRLEKAAARIADRRVEIAGWTPDARGALLAADLACLPSRWEASSYAALEAMACGRPVVASAVDGLEEIVDHGVTGLLVPPDDPAALAAAIDELADQPERVILMGRAAHARVAARYRLGRMVDETLAVYREVA